MIASCRVRIAPHSCIMCYHGNSINLYSIQYTVLQYLVYLYSTYLYSKESKKRGHVVLRGEESKVSSSASRYHQHCYHGNSTYLYSIQYLVYLYSTYLYSKESKKRGHVVLRGEESKVSSSASRYHQHCYHGNSTYLYSIQYLVYL